MKKFAALISVAVLPAAAMAAPADQINEQVVVVETASAPVGTASAPAADASAAIVSAPVAR